MRSLLKIYGRTVLSQGVGIAGLIWSLADRQLGVGLLLAVLVLADQVFFLYGRFRRDDERTGPQTLLDLWCLAIGFLDVVLVFAVLFRGGPLRERGTGAVVGDTWDALALSLATFFHLRTDLDPGDSGMRLVMAVEGLVGAAALAGLAVALVSRFGASLRRS